MKLTAFGDFIQEFNISKISFIEFTNKATTNRGILITEWLDSFPDTDLRKQNKDKILSILYNFMVIDAEKNLEIWFNEHIKIDDLDKYTKFNLDKNIIDNDIINGKYNNLTRINKSLFWKEIYDTPKLGYNTKPTLFLTLKAVFEEYCLPRCWGLPMGIKKVLNNDASGLYAILRGTEQKASTFNPYTIGYIIENIYKAKKIFTPVLGWNSYLLGSFNTNVEEYIGVDVIDKVVDNAKEISEYYESNGNIKKTKFYCCPSEKLDETYNFVDEYDKYFDSAFLSPPYFNLEKYRDGEQSILNFPNYNDWLTGYWEETCKLCYDVLQNDGHFGFVVSDYKDGKTWMNISEDMLKIAKKYFTLENQYYITWNSFKILDSEKMKNGNFENFYFMSKK